MPIYDRHAPTTCQEIDRWSDGVGWLAHPDEGGCRASHAIRDENGDVWLFDPLDAPGVDDLIAELVGPAGAVAGVVVLSDYHARDADVFAERYDVPVHLPRFVERARDRIDAPIEPFDDGVAGFEITRFRPLYAYDEAIAYRERDRTLYVPDYLSSLPAVTVGRERIALPTTSRLFPPRDRLADLTPDRVLFGHGEGVFEDADAALRDTFENARTRLPRALVTALPTEIRAVLGAFR